MKNKKHSCNISLPKSHFFIDKIKINYDIIYYLWNDKSNPNSNKTLYKVKINN